MKTSLSIAILFLASTAHAQINQKTIELRKHYTNVSTYQLRLNRVPPGLQFSFLYRDPSPSVSRNLMAARPPRPSTHSIEKAFTYYNSLKKPVDLSGVLIVGYSLLSNQQFIVNTTPQEAVRFSPADTKD